MKDHTSLCSEVESRPWALAFEGSPGLQHCRARENIPTAAANGVDQFEIFHEHTRGAEILLGVIAYNVGNLLRRLVLPPGGRLIRHARYFILPSSPTPLDTAPLWADLRAHQATRRASDLSQSPGQVAPWKVDSTIDRRRAHAPRRGRRHLARRRSSATRWQPLDVTDVGQSTEDRHGEHSVADQWRVLRGLQL